MNCETSIYTFEFVHGFNSEQRFHQIYHGRMMLQRHVWCSSVQCRMSIKSYLIDNTNFLGKRWYLAFSMHYLTLATLLDHAVPVCTCQMFCFTGMMHVHSKIVLILPGADSSSSHEKKKRWQSLYIFLKPRCMNVWYFESAWRYASL